MKGGFTIQTIVLNRVGLTRFVRTKTLYERILFLGIGGLGRLKMTLTGDEPEWRNVLSRIHRALKPGGTVVISELPYPDSMPDYRSSPVYQVLAGVQIHEAIVGCGMITMSQLGGLLRDAGFANVRAVDQPMPTRYVMVGEK